MIRTVYEGELSYQYSETLSRLVVRADYVAPFGSDIAVGFPEENRARYLTPRLGWRLIRMLLQAELSLLLAEVRHKASRLIGYRHV